ncbi:glycoside hydrolase superfamily [Desarmillaria ectypa]|nr:glycoside hydrolase superfamily [Desarmillaria ectypa]
MPGRYDLLICVLQQALTQTTTSTALVDSAPTDPPSTQTGKTPALGWNTWNFFINSSPDISEAKVLAAANSVIDLGLADVGYEYINIMCESDILPYEQSLKSKIIPDYQVPERNQQCCRPGSALGLKFGIYGDAGTAMCSGFTGSLGMEAIDAATFNEWGIDYLKYDKCNVPENWNDSCQLEGDDWYNSKSTVRYRQMG